MKTKPSSTRALPISSINHISVLCSSVEKSAAFYEHVLGFVPIKRPGSFDFDGAWLFNYGMGLHLIQAPHPSALPPKSDINPKDNHISFQCQEGIQQVEHRLKELGVRHVKLQVVEGGVLVDQIFFHDPDGFMIEVCTCENLPVVPLNSTHSIGSGGGGGGGGSICRTMLSRSCSTTQLA